MMTTYRWTPSRAHTDWKLMLPSFLSSTSIRYDLVLFTYDDFIFLKEFQYPRIIEEKSPSSFLSFLVQTLCTQLARASLVKSNWPPTREEKIAWANHWMSAVGEAWLLFGQLLGYASFPDFRALLSYGSCNFHIWLWLANYRKRNLNSSIFDEETSLLAFIISFVQLLLLLLLYILSVFLGPLHPTTSTFSLTYWKEGSGNLALSVLTSSVYIYIAHFVTQLWSLVLWFLFSDCIVLILFWVAFIWIWWWLRHDQYYITSMLRWSEWFCLYYCLGFPLSLSLFLLMLACLPFNGF